MKMKQLATFASFVALLANSGAAMAESDCHDINLGQNYSFNVSSNSTYQWNAPSGPITLSPFDDLAGVKTGVVLGSVTGRRYNSGCVEQDMRVVQYAKQNSVGTTTGYPFVMRGGANKFPCVSSSNKSPSQTIPLPNMTATASSNTLNGNVVFPVKSNDFAKYPVYNVTIGVTQFLVSIIRRSGSAVSGIEVCRGHHSSFTS